MIDAVAPMIGACNPVHITTLADAWPADEVVVAPLPEILDDGATADRDRYELLRQAVVLMALAFLATAWMQLRLDERAVVSDWLQFLETMFILATFARLLED